MTRKLYRDDQNKSVGGVCLGLADYFNVDVTIVRAIFLIGALCTKGGFVPLYIILWIVLPKKPFAFATPGVDFTVDPQASQSQQFDYKAPKRKSNFGIFSGLILIGVGGALLLDQYGIIPDIDFNKLWPVLLVLIGLSLVFSSGGKKIKEPVEPNPPTL